jgi:5-methylcytosine-specific restriction endonuclease McrA
MWTLWGRHRGQETANAEQLIALFETQKGVCPLTHRVITYRTAELDHIIAVAQGGLGTIDNLRWVHKDANQAKMKLSDGEFDAVCIDRAKVLGMNF